MAIKKCMSCGGSMKKMKEGGSIAAGIPYATGAGATDGKNGMMKKGGMVKAKYGIIVSSKNSKIQPPVKLPKPTLKPLNGRANVVLRNKPNTGSKPKITLKKGKVGGTVSANKFAALAPPYDKATFADKIAGAKRKATKKQ